MIIDPYASRESRKEAFMSKNTTVKDLPDSEKPYEKFLAYGPEYLSDAELLAVIIRSGTNGQKSVMNCICFLLLVSGSAWKRSDPLLQTVWFLHTFSLYS